MKIINIDNIDFILGDGVPCPIRGTFSFSYSRGHGLCSYPASSLHQCAGKYHIIIFCADILLGNFVGYWHFAVGCIGF